jgi:hypothetical protein
MPAEGIHVTAVREATASPALDPSLRRRLVRNDDAARFGAILVDLPYFHQYATEVVRYLAGLPGKPSPWGAALHDGGAVELLFALLDVARREHDELLAAVALGVASHCSIDRALHPLINALARQHKAGIDHDASHREVEKFQSICFHEVYLGGDKMGTPGITGHLAIRLMGQLDDRRSSLIREAWRNAFGDAPHDDELVGFRRGYRAHARLLGTPLGKRLAPPAAKDAARPKYLHGAWGTFEGSLEQAIAASVEVMNGAGAVLEATTADAPAARAHLASLLPRGTIDPMGHEVDLGAPYPITLRFGERRLLRRKN